MVKLLKDYKNYKKGDVIGESRRGEARLIREGVAEVYTTTPSKKKKPSDAST